MNFDVRVHTNTIDEALQKDLTRIDELWSEGLTRLRGSFLAGENFSGVDAFFCTGCISTTNLWLYVKP
jgi:glutathione S-transferase